MALIGRLREKQRLEEFCKRNKAQFIALYGRRRVGKTFLIREFFVPRSEVFFSVTGIQHEKKQTQIELFQKSLEDSFFKGARLASIKTWKDAFEQLIAGIKIYIREYKPKQLTLFLDELPWLATRKSDLLGALDHAWNTELQYIPCIRLIICGSAASWMIRNVIESKGGLHNRLTGTLRLQVFTLHEVKQYLQIEKKIKIPDSQIIELYMALGGVPYYLSHLQKNLSIRQNIGSLCFGDGELVREFDKLFQSLFDNADQHIKIIRALATKLRGLSREELIKTTRLQSGSQFTKWLTELEEAGFIESYRPIDKKTKDTLYRLSDEFSLFHIKWIEQSTSRSLIKNPAAYWVSQCQTPNYAVWAGYAFEALCFKHSHLIKRAVGFEAVASRDGSYTYRDFRGNTKGFQIDLVFDRTDNVITLCEMKYYHDAIVVTDKLRNEWQEKINRFKTVSGTQKHVNLILVTPFGIKENRHSQEILAGIVTLEDLFKT